MNLMYCFYFLLLIATQCQTASDGNVPDENTCQRGGLLSTFLSCFGRRRSTIVQQPEQRNPTPELPTIPVCESTPDASTAAPERVEASQTESGFVADQDDNSEINASAASAQCLRNSESPIHEDSENIPSEAVQDEPEAVSSQPDAVNASAAEDERNIAQFAQPEFQAPENTHEAMQSETANNAESSATGNVPEEVEAEPESSNAESEGASVRESPHPSTAAPERLEEPHPNAPPPSTASSEQFEEPQSENADQDDISGAHTPAPRTAASPQSDTVNDAVNADREDDASNAESHIGENVPEEAEDDADDENEPEEPEDEDDAEADVAEEAEDSVTETTQVDDEPPASGGIPPGTGTGTLPKKSTSSE